MNDHGIYNESGIYGIYGAHSTLTVIESVVQIWNVLCALCLVLIILGDKQLRGDPNNWPMLHFGMIAISISLFKIIFGYRNDIKLAKAIPGIACLVFQVVVYALLEAQAFAQLLLLIDRLDWLADSSRHDKRMTRQSYAYTIAALVVVGFVISIGFFAGLYSKYAHQGCVNDVPSPYLAYCRIHDVIQILFLLAIFIGTLTVYKKRPATEDNVENAAEAKETAVFVCIQSGVTIPLIVLATMSGVLGSMTPYMLYQASIGLTCLLMIGVFTKIRHLLICRRSETDSENIPLK